MMLATYDLPLVALLLKPRSPSFRMTTASSQIARLRQHYFVENLNTVFCRNVSPGFSVVVGNSG